MAEHFPFSLVRLDALLWEQLRSNGRNRELTVLAGFDHLRRTSYFRAQKHLQTM